MSRGVIGAVIGIFVIILVFTLLAGPLIEPVAEIVAEDEAVQEAGHGDTIDRMERVILQWGPIVSIGGVLLLAARWYLRREQLTGVRRR